MTGSAVSAWINRGQLTPPALREDGLIDAERADRQLAETVSPTRSIAHLGRVVPDTPAMIRAAALATLYLAIEVDFLRPAVATLGLTPTQCEALGRHWYRFRAKTSQGG